MDVIADYSNQHHRRFVVELWETVFGYETAHNTPSLAIDKKLAAADGLFFVAWPEMQLLAPFSRDTTAIVDGCIRWRCTRRTAEKASG